MSLASFTSLTAQTLFQNSPDHFSLHELRAAVPNRYRYASQTVIWSRYFTDFRKNCAQNQKSRAQCRNVLLNGHWFTSFIAGRMAGVGKKILALKFIALHLPHSTVKRHRYHSWFPGPSQITPTCEEGSGQMN